MLIPQKKIYKSKCGILIIKWTDKSSFCKTVKKAELIKEGFLFFDQFISKDSFIKKGKLNYK